ncbi:MAG: hypothetical protein MJE66_14115 [Proteobacteria bacterium]|nr:hypothetical protein [Pseudomonadota bacterium]
MPLEPDSPLAELVGTELARPAPAGVESLSAAIRERHGDAVAGILFYGSCLRRGNLEGVVDLYVLVDGYRAAQASIATAMLGYLLPPNVFYLEVEHEGERLRAKYALLSTTAFAAAVGPDCLHAYIWARFAQPALLVYARDDDARASVVDAVGEAIVTLVQRLGVFLPVRHGAQRFASNVLWNEAFRRTYGAELRTESADSVRALYEAAPERYDAAAARALELLEQRGWLDEINVHGDKFAVRMPAGRRTGARFTWHFRRPIAKLLAFLRLVKTAFTFGDWLPYVLWKLERHTGTRVELSERQRRHPLVFGWPVIARLVWRRDLR